MSAVVFILIVLLALIVGIMIGAYFYEPINEASHAAKRNLRKVPALQQHSGRHRAVAPLVVALPAAQVIAHADKMHEISERYVTPEEWQSYMNAGRAIEPVRVADEHPPWTGSQPALTPELEEQMRGEYLASYLAEQEGMSDDEVRQAMLDAVDAWKQPVHGERCEAHVLAGEAERLAGRVIA